ncbi:hypothetical protein MKP08_10540 [Erythrobacter sp. LQ02-29]|uniref:hypothetical protein n=1 Tax=Erythrobacter sp. LQ02-29 TaxID=2920384 RepID=UPI001F4DBC68|nr:hypothetical protein [Erythrobacter sp. LQ02-29]MCP9223187.1 hypothetical protein [Erythrobacter sp. LQ02-29]
MSYSENPVTENERATLPYLGWFGLADALLALACRLLGFDGSFTWLLTLMAGSLLFTQSLNYRARDEYLDALILAGARCALGLLGTWVTIVGLISLFTLEKPYGPPVFLTDQMTTVCAVMVAYFAGFCLKRWRSQ